MKLTKFIPSLQETFNNFVRGSLMSSSLCQLLVDEVSLGSGSKATSYPKILKLVKSKLTAESVILTPGIIYVDYPIEGEENESKIEKLVLVRMINLLHKGDRIIILNEKESIYIPKSYSLELSEEDLHKEITTLVYKQRNKNNKIRNLRGTDQPKTDSINPEVLVEAMASYTAEQQE